MSETVPGPDQTDEPANDTAAPDQEQPGAPACGCGHVHSEDELHLYQHAIPAGTEAIEVLTDLAARRLTNATTTGIPFGFQDLDLLTNGIQAGQLVVIGSYSGVGKSTLARDIARSCAVREGLPAVIYSYEQTERELVDCILAAEADIPLHRIRTATVAEEESQRLTAAAGSLTQAPLFIDATTAVMESVIERTEALKRRFDIKLAVIDSWGLAVSPAEAALYGPLIKNMAVELSMAVVVVAQCRRPSRPVPLPPTVHDLRDDGHLADAADLVLMLHRDDAHTPVKGPRAGITEVTVTGRAAPPATISLRNELHYGRHRDLRLSA
ncbi:DnaB-like helicase C-terminal domain-containing protein [Kitasatospora sp. NPDC056076]|uniref:DnaB-like helicase C-terminal domain-containing protein n=1 Tax=Kitasatospora sp. NPDC056076 TaxID=3345703 RepID=UPI0035D9C093